MTLGYSGPVALGCGGRGSMTLQFAKLSATGSGLPMEHTTNLALLVVPALKKLVSANKFEVLF